MKTHDNLYNYLCSMGNLTLAWRNARKGKTLHKDIIEFEKDTMKNLVSLHYELKNKSYCPMPLKTFILRDPKTRKISKSDFRDRIVHHALINVIGKIFERTFIYDSCANQIGKGNLFALKRLEHFKRKVTKDYTIGAFCLKADVKHYFEEVNHEILLSIIQRKVKDKDVIWLIKQILANNVKTQKKKVIVKKGMPLGNYTSQFFANVYLNELDYFVKHELKVKYYIRYVDDFVILHNYAKQIVKWKEQIVDFLRDKLKLQLHPQKSKIVPLSSGVDFVGFRNYNVHRLLRKRNIRNMQRKVDLFRDKLIDFRDLFDIYQGWQAYAMWANTYKLRNKLKIKIIDIIWEKLK